MRPRDVLIGFAIALVVAVAISPFASSAPDGLEWAADRIGLSAHAAGDAVIESPLRDYQMSAIRHGGVSTAAAGGTGVAVAALSLLGLGRLLRRRRPNDEAAS